MLAVGWGVQGGMRDWVRVQVRRLGWMRGLRRVSSGMVSLRAGVTRPSNVQSLPLTPLIVFASNRTKINPHVWYHNPLVPRYATPFSPLTQPPSLALSRIYQYCPSYEFFIVCRQPPSSVSPTNQPHRSSPLSQRSFRLRFWPERKGPPARPPRTRRDRRRRDGSCRWRSRGG